MRAQFGIISIAGAALLALSGCGGDDTPQLMNLRHSGTPDEFAVLPAKPLEIPTDLASLPQPTPGGANRTDPTPEADAVAALGGKPGAVTPSGKISSGDAGLVNYSSRYGTSAGIRSQLAAEDLEYRKKHDGRLLERVFSVSIYYKAYQPMSLDQQRELDYWRSRGVRTVGAPPPPLPE